MKFLTDSYIEIGKSHNICEDYTLNGLIDNKIPYIIVSDGCTSSKMTDMGSRILSHSCRKVLFDCYNSHILEKLNGNELRKLILNNIKHVSMGILETLKLPYEICDATLLFAFIYNNKLFIHCYGDGNIIIKCKNNRIIWHNLSYESNAPFYISYDMDILRKKNYLETPDFGKKPFNITEYGIETHGDHNHKFSHKAKYSPEIPFSLELDIGEINSITLSSDGIETYSHNSNVSIKFSPSDEEIQSLNKINMIQRMVSYKNYNGVFVKRRMKKLKQEIEKIHADHFDDVSSATIYINHDE